MSVLDKLNRPIRDVRLSLTDRCNFRCVYCMPKEAAPYLFSPQEDILSADEIFNLCRILQAMGLKKIRLTGGEPLLRQDLIYIVMALSELDPLLDISITTNGFNLLHMAKPLKKAGLHRVTISLDSLQEDTFQKMSGTTVSIEKVLAGIEACVQAGFEDIKVNMIVIKGMNDHEVSDFVTYFTKKRVTVRFIEYMDVGSKNNWSKDLVVPTRELLAKLKKDFVLEPLYPTYTGEVASRYSVNQATGVNQGIGEIGFISSISKPFCQNCHRLRVTAKGDLVGCLFSKKKLSILSTLRPKLDEGALTEMITCFWQNRDDQYSMLRGRAQDVSSVKKIEMYQVGG